MSRRNVYLLLALRTKETTPIEQKEDEKKSKDVSQEELKIWEGQNFSVAAYYFHHRGIDYRIRRFILSKSIKQNGKIHKLDLSPQNSFLVDVYYKQESAKRGRSGYERVKIKLEEEGPCLIESIALDQKALSRKERQHVFSTRRHKEDEEVEILFYRQGAMRLEAKCGGEKIYDKSFYPESIS